MSGIDRQDQMNSYYPFTRKTIRWYKKLGIHIIQMLLLNSYNLYNQYNIGTTLSLYDFRIIVLSKILPKPEKPSKSLSIKKTYTYHLRMEWVEMGEICEKDVSCATKTVLEKIVHTTVTLALQNQVCV